MAKQKTIERPNLRRSFFWDTNYDTLDFQKAYDSIIGRIIERGDKADWEEIVRFYGFDKAIYALKHEIVYLPDDSIEEVCAYFPIKKEEMRCYIRKQSRVAH